MSEDGYYIKAADGSLWSIRHDEGDENYYRAESIYPYKNCPAYAFADWGPDMEDFNTIRLAKFGSKADAKTAYRAVHGRFPRGLTVIHEDELHEVFFGSEPVADAEVVDAEVVEDNPGAEVAVLEDNNDTIHDGEVVEDGDLLSLASQANKFYADFNAAGHSALVAAWNCGAALNRAKQLVGQHGQWKDWIEANFDGSYRLAASYMQIAANVQTSALSEYNSINGVLKAIAAGKDKPAKPARSMHARASAILKAAEKLAEVVHAFTIDMDAEEHDADDFESEMNQASDAITAAFEDFDSTFNEVFA